MLGCESTYHIYNRISQASADVGNEIYQIYATVTDLCESHPAPAIGRDDLQFQNTSMALADELVRKTHATAETSI
jgi:hypothetical protein